MLSFAPERDPSDNPVQEMDFSTDSTFSSSDVRPRLSASLSAPFTSDEVQSRREYGTVTGAGMQSALPEETNATVRPQSLVSLRALAPDLLRGLLMVLQSLDHSALFMGAWQHGVAREQELDGRVMYQWNFTTAWVARLLTHLCAPGFMFLMGMGIVYFGQSRTVTSNWSTKQMAFHVAMRALVLALVNQILFGWLGLWIVNIVLLALAINYLLGGFLWIAIDACEKALTRLLISETPRPEASESQLLLRDNSQIPEKPPQVVKISWHIHNLVLLVLTGVTIWWNHWLSPYHGRCEDDIMSPGTSWGPAFDFWFYPVQSEHIMSVFPPLGWISFVILGLLYARIVLARRWSRTTINVGNALAGVVLLFIFILTRLFQFGNLSQNCLRMPEQLLHPNDNPFLVDFKSFLYTVKYPPDLAFFTLTMGVNFLLLAIFGLIPIGYARRSPMLMIFGTSALFFYVIHLLLFQGLALPVKMLFGHDVGFKDPRGNPMEGTGNSPVFWITWLLGLGILYPLCRRYSRFKSTKGRDSVWRFF
jgi:uncharacterized membrane protein